MKSEFLTSRQIKKSFILRFSALSALERASSLGCASADESRIEANISDMIRVRQPTHEPLQSETVPAMRHRPVTALIRIPAKVTNKSIRQHSFIYCFLDYFKLMLRYLHLF